MHARARVVVLAAGTLESTRLLLNSGIANSSGLIGRYLIDQLYGCTVVAAMPEARDGANPALIGGGLFMPRFRNLGKDEKAVRGGYCLPMGTGSTPDANTSPNTAPPCRRNSIATRAPALTAASTARSCRATKITSASTNPSRTPGAFHAPH